MSNRLVANSSPISHPISQTQPNSSTSTKLRALFITQKSNPAPQPQNDVFQRHSELNSYIDDLDEKIQKIVQHNESELLFAYRNHLDRVRNEMTEFKEETVARISDQANHQQRIEMLQTQLAIFREEALRLFQKALQKDKLIEELRIRLSQFRSQKNYMDDTLKSLMKRNKQLQASIQTYSNGQDPIFHNEYLGKIQVNSFASLGVSTHKKMYKREKKPKDRTPTTNSKMFTQSNFNTDDFIEDKEDNLMAGLRQFSKRLKLRLGYLQSGILQNILDSAGEVYSQIEPKRTKYIRAHIMSKTGASLRSKSYTSDSSQSIIRSNCRNHPRQDHKVIQSIQSNELKDYFRNCIEIVKKEIARRKKVNSINFFKDGGPITLEQFKRIDFFRLLELVFANENIIRNLYNQLFDLSL